jgi:hypothetical protein
MAREIRKPASTAPRPNALSISLKWTARFLFAASVFAVGYGIWYGRTHPVTAPAEALRQKAVSIDWSREPFQHWTSPEDGVEVTYPSRYEAVRAFGRFTSRDLVGGLVETDVVAFRSAEPRSVILIAGYKSPRPLAWEEWIALAKEEVQVASGPGKPSSFSAEFGGSDKTYRRVKAGDRSALAVSATGAVKYPIRGNEQMELWRFESRLVAQGDTAVRITAGVHSDQYAATRPGLERTVESFRWSPR